MDFGHSHASCLFYYFEKRLKTHHSKSRGSGREIREMKTLKHVDFCTACYEKKFISCDPRLSRTLTLLVLFRCTQKNFDPITYFLPPGIIALERCQGRFDIFFMFACKSPGYLSMEEDG